MNMAEREVSNAFIWKTLERYCVMGVQFLLQLLLARILTPNDFGVIAILSIFIAFANIFVQSGLTTTLVQKKDLKDIEIYSVFNFSLIIASFIYILLFCCAPLIAQFFNMPGLKDLLRVISLTIFPFSFNSLQTSLLRRKLQFKPLFICTCLSVAVSGAVAVVMALNGFGVWALVSQQIIYSVTISITLCYYVRWFPRLYFCFNEIKEMLDYGAKVLATSLVNEIFVEVRTIVIGKLYAPAALAFFNRGRSFPDLGTKSIIGSLQSVLLPILARNQDDKDIQRNIVRKTILIGTFITWPLLGLICICGQPFISLCLTDKWLPCVFYIYVFSIYFATWPLETINLQLYYAIGESGVVLKLESLRKVLDIIILMMTMWYGVAWIAIGAAIVSVICLPIYIYPANKFIGYGLMMQIRDITPILFITLASCSITLLWRYIFDNPLILILLQSATMICIYIAISRLTNSQALIHTIEYCKLYLKR